MVVCYLVDFNEPPCIPSWGVPCATQECRGATIDLGLGSILGSEVNVLVIQDAVHWQMAKRRSGTAQAKVISEISATTRKPWKQKGTGRARHGNLVAPQFRGGAVALGPRARSHEYSINKKVRKRALHMALSLKSGVGCFSLVRGRATSEIKTKLLSDRLRDYVGFSYGVSVLYCMADPHKEVLLSGRNIPNFNITTVAGLNVRDIISADIVLLDEGAMEGVLARVSV